MGFTHVSTGKSRRYPLEITYIPFSFPHIEKVRCLFQTRQGGSSMGAYGGGNIVYAPGDDRTHVLQNRTALQQAVGYGFSELAQVHGDVLVFEPELTPLEGFQKSGQMPEADGLATSCAGHALMIKTADCQPILIAHAQGKHIMGLHVGWRGNKIGFIGTAIAAFCKQYNLVAKDLYAVRGPSLGPQNAEFVNFDLDWGKTFTQWFDEKNKTMNLWELTRHQLHEAGLPHAHIYGIDMCTYGMNDVFFSYRREELSGRQGSLIWIEPTS